MPPSPRKRRLAQKNDFRGTAKLAFKKTRTIATKRRSRDDEMAQELDPHEALVGQEPFGDERNFLLEKSPLVRLVDGDGREVEVRQWLLEMRSPVFRALFKWRSEQSPAPMEPISVPLNSRELDCFLLFLSHHVLRKDDTVRLCWVVGRFYAVDFFIGCLFGERRDGAAETLKMMCAAGQDFTQNAHLRFTRALREHDVAFCEKLHLKICMELAELQITLAEDKNLRAYLEERQEEILSVIKAMELEPQQKKPKTDFKCGKCNRDCFAMPCVVCGPLVDPRFMYITSEFTGVDKDNLPVCRSDGRFLSDLERKHALYDMTVMKRRYDAKHGSTYSLPTHVPLPTRCAGCACYTCRCSD